MARGRRIVFSPECDNAASALGGYEKVDPSLDTVWDVLRNDPYKLPRLECDWFMVRYIFTKRTRDAPALIWLIKIEENGDIIIEHVEKSENY